MKVNILEAKNRLSQLIKNAQAGREVVIANRGAPVARLIAIGPASEPDTTPSAARPGSARLILEWLHERPLPPYARRSPAELDADIETERSGWD